MADEAEIGDARTFTLAKPIEGPHGEVIKEFTFREPTFGDLRVLDQAKGRIDGTGRLLAKLTGVHPRAINGLSMQDLAGLTELLESLTGDLAELGRNTDDRSERED